MRLCTQEIAGFQQPLKRLDRMRLPTVGLQRNKLGKHIPTCLSHLTSGHGVRCHGLPNEKGLLHHTAGYALAVQQCTAWW
jgi:hypothetical protein